MPKSSISARAKQKGEITEVRMLISHPMETGLRRHPQTEEPIPAHFIQELTCMHRGRAVLKAHWGIAVARDPYLAFKFTGARKGEVITISWVDNRGNSDTVDAPIG